LLLLSSLFFYTQNPKVETFKILPKTEVETSLTVINGKSPGKCVFVIGGIHGDEIAGWKAANKLKKQIKIKSGTVCIISPANKTGALEGVRYVEDYSDLNRAFPGDANGVAADKLAAAIFEKIKAYSPDIVIDLHEAHILEPGQDFLGSSLIFTSMDGMEDLLPEIIAATENGEICSDAFNYFGPAPRGSVNRTVCELLKTPSLTVETYREYPLSRRINDHCDIVNYILEYYEMV
ncbi:MAG: succinylglutamate desuccinylase/aspartoacylase family protein, partial [Oscillospiraceae bacterium]